MDKNFKRNIYLYGFLSVIFSVIIYLNWNLFVEMLMDFKRLSYNVPTVIGIIFGTGLMISLSYWIIKSKYDFYSVLSFSFCFVLSTIYSLNYIDLILFLGIVVYFFVIKNVKEFKKNIFLDLSFTSLGWLFYSVSNENAVFLFCCLFTSFLALRLFVSVYKKFKVVS